MPTRHDKPKRNVPPSYHQRESGHSPDKPSSSSSSRIPQADYIQVYDADLVDEHQSDASAESDSAKDWEGVYNGEDIWADRYDIVHQGSSAPVYKRKRGRSATRSTSSSRSELPSDAEDVSPKPGPEKSEEYEREKKRRWIDALREDRLREREKEDKEQELLHAVPKADPDEQPPEAILTLMRHTAKALSASPSPQLLEMRILANHSSDDRFAFLRGRYSATWTRIKAELRVERTNDPKRKAKEEKAVGALIGGYEDSDEDEDEDADELPAPPVEEVPPPPFEPAPPTPPSRPEDLPLGVMICDVDEREGSAERQAVVVVEENKEELQRRRRLRAEEWKRKRKLAEGAS